MGWPWSNSDHSPERVYSKTGSNLLGFVYLNGLSDSTFYRRIGSKGVVLEGLPKPDPLDAD